MDVHDLKIKQLLESITRKFEYEKHLIFNTIEDLVLVESETFQLLNSFESFKLLKSVLEVKGQSGPMNVVLMTTQSYSTYILKYQNLDSLISKT